MTKSNFALAAAALAALVLTAAAPALAETNVWQVGQGYTVRDGDLDRRTPTGRAKLLARVEAASAKVCAGRAPRVRYEGCVTRSRDAAIAGSSAAARQALTLALVERANAVQLAAN